MSRIARRVFSLVAIPAVFSGGFAIAEGCGSDSFTAAPSTDGGNDGSTPTDASQDAGPQDSGPALVADACVKPPTAANPSMQAFCDAYAEISTRCLDCSECRRNDANNCDAFGSSISDGFRKGIVACKDQISCDEFSTQTGLAEDPCVDAWIADAGVTTVQVAARDDYCERCENEGGTDLQSCKDAYFGLPDGGGDIGGVILVSSDPTVEQIQTSCPFCGPIIYGGCTIGTLCNSAGRDGCNLSTLCPLK